MMRFQPDLVGTVTLTSGEVAFEVDGINLVSQAVLPGDLVLLPTVGAVLTIQEVTDATTGELTDPCPAMLAGTDVPCRIRFQSDLSRNAAAARDLLTRLSSGSEFQLFARASATANVSIAAPGTSMFDGVSLGVGERIMLPFQADLSQNGLWIFNGSGAPMTRAPVHIMPGTSIWVGEGSTLQQTAFVLTTPAPISVGVTDLYFSPLINTLPFGTAVKDVRTPSVFNGTRDGDHLLTAPMIAAGAVVAHNMQETSPANGRFVAHENGMVDMWHRLAVSYTAADRMQGRWTLPLELANTVDAVYTAMVFGPFASMTPNADNPFAIVNFGVTTTYLDLRLMTLGTPFVPGDTTNLSVRYVGRWK